MEVERLSQKVYVQKWKWVDQAMQSAGFQGLTPRLLTSGEKDDAENAQLTEKTDKTYVFQSVCQDN